MVHLGLRGKAMHYRRIPEGLGWVGRRLFGMHTGQECNEGNSIAYNGHHDRTIAPVVLHGRAVAAGTGLDGYRPNGTIVGSRARDHDMKLMKLRVAPWLSPALPRTAMQ